VAVRCLLTALLSKVSNYLCLVDGLSNLYLAGVKRSKTVSDPTITTTLRKAKADGRVPAYDAFQEEGRPKLVIYHPSFTQAESLVTAVIQEFLSTVHQLKESGYPTLSLKQSATTSYIVSALPKSRTQSLAQLLLSGRLESANRPA
jgi:hypothetical protein